MKADPRQATVTPPRRTLRCPACGGESVYALSNPARPFCSARCRLTDLGAWASEGYRVASSEPRDDAEESVSGDPDPASAR
ncbi:MAG TPA: DNA gyrase inhibitor YacG [Caldimonas sp.]|nr:DNA gyrase inhibitor YacG [Caldimonas sp.]